MDKLLWLGITHSKAGTSMRMLSKGAAASILMLFTPCKKRLCKWWYGSDTERNTNSTVYIQQLWSYSTISESTVYPKVKIIHSCSGHGKVKSYCRRCGIFQAVVPAKKKSSLSNAGHFVQKTSVFRVRWIRIAVVLGNTKKTPAAIRQLPGNKRRALRGSSLSRFPNWFQSSK